MLGCPIDDLTYDTAVQAVDAYLQSRTPARVGAVNAAKLLKMEEDPALAGAVRACEIILADGVGAVFAARALAGASLKRVTGIDLMEKLLDLAERKGYGVYLFGARQEVLERLQEVLRERYPGLRVAGSRNGYFSAPEEQGIVEAIRESGAHLVFVAMGTPAKELWIDRHFHALGNLVCMGVGGSFDVLSGTVSRAPVWMQRAGMEWFYRFLQEPRRMWRRYFITSFRFLFRVLADVPRSRLSRGGRA